MKKTFYLFILLSFQAISSISYASEDEERVVILSHGPMPPWAEMHHSSDTNSLNLNTQSGSLLYSVDHRNLYVIDKNSSKLLDIVNINPLNEDWVFHIGVKNGLLVVFGFSPKLQANKIIRYKESQGVIKQLDHYVVEFLPNEYDGINNFNSPLIVGNKIVVHYESRDFLSFKVFKVNAKGKKLVRDLHLKNLDEKNFSDITVFFDVFRQNMDIREVLQNDGYSWNGVDGYKAYQQVYSEDIKKFDKESTLYSDYFSFITNHYVYQQQSEAPYNYLLTLDFDSESFSFRPFDKLPKGDWDIDFYPSANSQITNHSFSASNPKGEEMQLFLNEDWSPRLIVPIANPRGWFSQYSAFNKTYFFIADDSYRSKDIELQTSLYYVDEYDAEMKSVDLKHSINTVMRVDSLLIIQGNDKSGVLNITIIDPNDHQIISSKKVKGYVDVLADEIKSIKLDDNKYVLMAWAATKENVKKYEQDFEMKDEYGNDYELLLLSFDKGKIKVVGNENLDVLDNNHCINHCMEDPKDFWDNRRILLNDTQVIIRKGSDVDFINFDTNFKYQKTTLVLPNSNGS